MTEQCWILTGEYDEESDRWLVTLKRHVSGDPASVEADWQWALSREEEKGDVLGFAHTHPQGASTQPSQRDVETMRAWCSAFGKPLLCLIGEGSELGLPDGYRFEDDASSGDPVVSFDIVVGEESDPTAGHQ